jgi:hypothetical protein
LILTLAFLKVGATLFLLAIFLPLILFAAIIYPYRLYKRLQKEGKLGNPDL